MASKSHPKKAVVLPSRQSHSQEWFGHFARVTAHAAGKPVVFIAAVAIVIIWALTGPFFHYSDTWQLVINTGTTIITFLMVFLIQNTQNRDQMAVQLKLGELILAMRGAENRLAVAEELSDEELEALHEECRQRADQALQSLAARRAAKQTEEAKKQPAGEKKDKRENDGQQKDGNGKPARKAAAQSKS